MSPVLWAILIALGLLGLAVALYVLFRAREMFTTAYVVVHPWDMGTTQEEVRNRLKELVKVGRATGLEVSEEEIFAKYARYCSVLAMRLKSCYARCVVLVDYAGHEDRSLELLAELLPRNRWRQVFIVETRVGRPEPLEVSWEQTCIELEGIGIQQIKLIGCLYGTHNGVAVEHSDIPFCVNFTANAIKETDRFEEVEIEVDACFCHEVAKITPPAPRRGFRTPPRLPKEKKKRRKR